MKFFSVLAALALEAPVDAGLPDMQSEMMSIAARHPGLGGLHFGGPRLGMENTQSEMMSLAARHPGLHHGGLMGNPMMAMSQIMASSQQAMAVAQNEREKAVTFLRKAAVSDFDRAAASLGDAIGKVSSELESHELVLEAAANASAVGLQKNAPKPGEFDFTKSHQRSKLKVEVDSAKQQVAHQRMQDKAALRQAGIQATQAIEAEAAQMGRKLGSMAPEVQEAEKVLQQHIIEATENLVHPPAGSSETNMDRLVKELREKEDQAAKEVKAARKQLADRIAKAGVKLQAEDKKILDNIDAKQVKALEGLFGGALDNKAKQQQAKKLTLKSK